MIRRFLLRLVVHRPLFHRVPRFRQLCLRCSCLATRHLIQSRDSIFRLCLDAFPLYLRYRQFHTNRHEGGMASTIRVGLPTLPRLTSRGVQRDVRCHRCVHLNRQTMFLCVPTRFVNHYKTIRFGPKIRNRLFPLFVLHFQIFMPVGWGYRVLSSFFEFVSITIYEFHSYGMPTFVERDVNLPCTGGHSSFY